MPAIPRSAVEDAVKPTVPIDAVLAAEHGFTCVSPGHSTRTRIRWALAAALPHLLPGLYVTHEQMREGINSIIWAEGTPAHPHQPEPLLTRTRANAHLFDTLAALLPDRTNDTEAE